ncbi:MAG: flagellar basal-body rod protein FlgG [Candidatus Hydrogenedentota bacterium]
MMRSLWTAASGMTAQQFNVDVISNNLANVNTTGYKKTRTEFEDLLYETLKLAGTPASVGSQIPTGIQVGHGVKPSSTKGLFTQGDFMQTDDPLNILIEGEGFFQVELPDGTIGYTRDGSFEIDSTGQMVTSQGYRLIDSEIVIPEDTLDIMINAEGVVNVRIAGQTALQEVGQINLANFINPSGLLKVGENVFKETAASGAPIVGAPGENDNGVLRQGFLELSNVKVVEEMVNLITAQRAYESNSKTIQAADNMLATAVNLRR